MEFAVAYDADAWHDFAVAFAGQTARGLCSHRSQQAAPSNLAIL